MKKVTERLLSLPHKTRLGYDHLQALHFLFTESDVTAFLKASAFVHVGTRGKSVCYIILYYINKSNYSCILIGSYDLSEDRCIQSHVNYAINILSLYLLRFIDSVLPCVCSVIVLSHYSRTLNNA